MRLHLQSDNSVTLIENIFIDRFMPSANGEFVKLYLYLLRCAGAGVDLSVSSIADFFDHTEKDVQRALSYWEKLNLLKLSYNADGSVSDIIILSGNEAAGADSSSAARGAGTAAPTVRGFNAPSASPAAPSYAGEVPAGQDFDSSSPAAPAFGSGAPDVSVPYVSAASDTVSSKPSPSRNALTPARRRQLKDQAEVRQLIFVGQQYLARPLTTTEINDLLYFYDVLHMDEDLIEYLLEYCASKGNPGVRYMEKIARSWYDKGITSVAQAKADSSLYNKNYYAILHAMGLGNRGPAEAEKQFMDRWLDEYGFSVEIILEACSRTILKTHEPSFVYADGILKSFKEQGVTSLSDVRRLDQAHEEKKPRQKRDDRKAAPAKNSFNNFPQRNLDWNALEEQLLGAQSGKEE